MNATCATMRGGCRRWPKPRAFSKPVGASSSPTALPLRLQDAPGLALDGDGDAPHSRKLFERAGELLVDEAHAERAAPVGPKLPREVGNRHPAADAHLAQLHA